MASPSRSTVVAKPKGLALNIGLNLVSAAAYSGWDGPLAACEFDANDMAALARSKGRPGASSTASASARPSKGSQQARTCGMR